MRILTYAIAVVIILAFGKTAYCDVVSYTLGTHDGRDLDFDGSGVATSGDLSTNSVTFVLTGNDLPDTQINPDFVGITSITINVMASSGNLSAHNTNNNTAGIGIASSGEGSGDSQLLNSGGSEVLTVSVSSTSTNPFQQVLLSEMEFSRWRNIYPISQAEFLGATVGGETFFTALSGDTAVFDIASSSVSVFSVDSHAGGGGWPFRLNGIGLTVVSVPEPSSGLVSMFALCGYCMVRRIRTGNKSSELCSSLK